jgi:dephospho-CoA kinase
MLKMGLTGGIGSGKSLVCKIFSTLGIPVFHSDEVSRDLMDHDPEIIRKITGIFGNGIYRNGILDRKALSGIVFTDKKALEKLNAIIHPAVSAVFDEWLTGCGDPPYIIKESAIIFESGTNKGLDYVIVVSAPEDLRVSRVMERDGTSEEEVLLRMRNQMNDSERTTRSDEIVYNDGHRLVIPQVLELHKKFTALSG